MTWLPATRTRWPDFGERGEEAVKEDGGGEGDGREKKKEDNREQMKDHERMFVCGKVVRLLC